MINLNTYIIEKLHLDKNVTIPKYIDKEYVIYLPSGSPENESLIDYYISDYRSETGSNGKVYLFSFNELKEAVKRNKEIGRLFVCKFNKEYIPKLDKVISKEEKLNKQEVGDEGVDFANKIIEKNNK